MSDTSIITVTGWAAAGLGLHSQWGRVSVRLTHFVRTFQHAVQRIQRRDSRRRLLVLRLGNLRDGPFELAALFVQLIRHGALEYRAEEQEPLRAVVQLLDLRAVILQDVVDDLAQDSQDFEPRAAPRREQELADAVDLERLEFLLARVAFELRALKVLPYTPLLKKPHASCTTSPFSLRFDQNAGKPQKRLLCKNPLALDT